MDGGMLEFIVQQTGALAIAALALYWQQQNHQAYMTRERENTETHRQDKQRLIDALEHNAAALNRLDQALSQVIDWGTVTYESAGKANRYGQSNSNGD